MNAKTLNIGHQKTQDAYISHVEFSQGTPPRQIEIEKFHRHNFYMITLILKGGGSHFIDFEQHDMLSGRLFLLIPGQVHLFQPSKEAEYFTVQFTADFFSMVSDKLFPVLQHFVLDLSEETTEELCHIFRHLLKEQSSDDANDIVMGNYINILIEKIKPEIRSTNLQNGKSHPAMIRFKELIEKKYHENLQVKDYALQLGISPNYLNILSKKETGISALSHIQNRLILEARRLLIHSGLSVSQIAHHLNFSDTSYFIKRFKEATRKTPGQFKTDFDKILHI